MRCCGSLLHSAGQTGNPAQPLACAPCAPRCRDVMTLPAWLMIQQALLDIGADVEAALRIRRTRNSEWAEAGGQTLQQVGGCR